MILRYNTELVHQNRSTEGCSKLKKSEDMTSSGKNGLNIRTNASPVPNGTGPGVRRRKRPLYIWFDFEEKNMKSYQICLFTKCFQIEHIHKQFE